MVFRFVGADVAALAERELADFERLAGDLSKATETPQERDEREQREAVAEAISQRVDLSGLSAIVDVAQPELEAMARSSAGEALAMIGVADRAQLVDVVNDRAVVWAANRAAELVGMRRQPDGTLTPNPNARFAITDSTRNMVRETIAHGLLENVGRDEIAIRIERISEPGGYAPFSAERAAVIASTEIRRTNSHAALAGYVAAAGAGVELRKAWFETTEACPVCQANAEQGPIPLDEAFQSGAEAPPQHVHCRCVLVPVRKIDKGA